MIGFSSHQNYYIYTEITDMRKGYNGLSGLVRNKLEADPTNGDVYVFFNRNRQLMKMLVWDHDGFAIYSKRLEKGRFSWPVPTEGKQGKIKLEPTALAMLMDGVDLRDGCKRAWYEKP